MRVVNCLLLGCFFFCPVSAQDIVSVWLPGTTSSPDPVLDEVRRLENQGRVWDVRVAASFPVRIHVTGAFETIQQLRAIAGLTYFVTIAEILTSTAPGEPVMAGYRLFSAPTMSQHCGRKPERLIVHNLPLSLTLEEPFSLDALVITAQDAEGQILPAVPARLDAEVANPPVVDLSADALADGRLAPLAPGSFRLRAQTICPGSTVTVTFEASISGN